MVRLSVPRYEINSDKVAQTAVNRLKAKIIGRGKKNIAPKTLAIISVPKRTMIKLTENIAKDPLTDFLSFHG